MKMPRSLVVLAGWLALTAGLPANPSLTITGDALSVLESNGHILSTATLCPGYVFSQFGSAGPAFSPDQHWILVDVLGPFEPGNVPRNHAIVHVVSGALILSREFPTYLGVPASLQALVWASGERASLRYQDGTVRALRDPPLKPIPRRVCASPPPR